MNWVGTLLVVGLVLLAGCVGGDAPMSVERNDVEQRVTSTADNSRGSPVAVQTTGYPTVTGTPEPTPTPTLTVTPPTVSERQDDNPWGQNYVVVGIDQQANPNRNITPLVRQALRYWENNSEEYAGYEIHYRLIPNRTQPDIEIQFVDEIAQCGERYTVDTVGCAPIIAADEEAPLATPIQIESGYSDDSTRLILKHELGHTLGLGHSASPAFMTTSGFHDTLPQPDVDDRAYRWQTSNFTVYVDDTNVSDSERDEYREQVRHALDYYESGPDGAPSNLSFTVVESRENATLVVRSLDADSDVSTATTFGYDPDGDEALEYYTEAILTLNGIDTDRTGYHVGYWLGMLIYAEDRSALPPPLQAGGEPADSEWWE